MKNLLVPLIEVYTKETLLHKLKSNFYPIRKGLEEEGKGLLISNRIQSTRFVTDPNHKWVCLYELKNRGVEWLEAKHIENKKYNARKCDYERAENILRENAWATEDEIGRTLNQAKYEFNLRVWDLLRLIVRAEKRGREN